MTPKRKRISMAAITILVVALSVTVVFSENPLVNHVNKKLVRVACLGDSITNITGYPEDLQTLLGNNSVVGNFGVNGATVNFYTDRPYYFDPAFREAKNFLPTTVIIMLGTNDARTNVYQQIINFTADYESMINRTQRWNSTQQIFLVIPPPIFNNILDLNGTGFAEGVVPRILQVATEEDLTIIDVYTPLLNHPEYFSDGVHPNDEGARAIANIIYGAIK
jgi:lysophospholipase L1-like esterase